MGNIYLAKSDLTGHVYAVKGRSKTDVTDFVVQLIKVETENLTATKDKIIEALKSDNEKLKKLVKSAFNAHQVHKVYDTDLVKIMDEWCEQAREALQTFARLEDK
jgi:uncharacterized protein YlaN (UPF0358 family)